MYAGRIVVDPVMDAHAKKAESLSAWGQTAGFQRPVRSRASARLVRPVSCGGQVRGIAVVGLCRYEPVPVLLLELAVVFDERIGGRAGPTGAGGTAARATAAGPRSAWAGALSPRGRARESRGHAPGYDAPPEIGA